MIVDRNLAGDTHVALVEELAVETLEGAIGVAADLEFAVDDGFVGGDNESMRFEAADHFLVSRGEDFVHDQHLSAMRESLDPVRRDVVHRRVILWSEDVVSLDVVEERRSEGNLVHGERSVVHESVGEEHVDDSDREIVLCLVCTRQDDLDRAVVEKCLELARMKLMEYLNGGNLSEMSEMGMSHIDEKLHRVKTTACVVTVVVVGCAPR